jgi:hypothetical protein
MLPKKRILKYFCIFPGNGHNILRAAMHNKKDWKEISKDEAFSGKCNFIWRPTNFNHNMFC